MSELQAAVEEAAGRAARASVDAAERSRLNNQVKDRYMIDIRPELFREHLLLLTPFTLLQIRY